MEPTFYKGNYKGRNFDPNYHHNHNQKVWDQSKKQSRRQSKKDKRRPQKQPQKKYQQQQYRYQDDTESESEASYKPFVPSHPFAPSHPLSPTPPLPRPPRLPLECHAGRVWDAEGDVIMCTCAPDELPTRCHSRLVIECHEAARRARRLARERDVLRAVLDELSREEGGPPMDLLIRGAVWWCAHAAANESELEPAPQPEQGAFARWREESSDSFGDEDGDVCMDR